MSARQMKNKGVVNIKLKKMILPASVYLLLVGVCSAACALVPPLLGMERGAGVSTKYSVFAWVFAVGFATFPFFLYWAAKHILFADTWKDLELPGGAELLLFGVLALYGLLFFCHSDILVTGAHGKLLLDALGEGRLGTYYSFVLDIPSDGAAYYLPVYLVFALWNLPVYLVSLAVAPEFLAQWVDYRTTSLAISLWNQLLPALFYVGIAYLILRIGRELGLTQKQSKCMGFLWLSCPVAMFGQFFFSQYDSIGLFFLMLSLLFYIKRDRRGFLFFAAIAMTFKLFALLAFLPLLLLWEKRPLFILRDLLLSVVGIGVCNIYVLTDPQFALSKSFEGDMVSKIFENGLPVAWGSASYFLICYIVICAAAYFHNGKAGGDHSRFAIYLLLAVYTTLFVFISWHPQWLLYLMPFWVLSLCLAKNRYVSLYLDIGLSAVFMAYVMAVFPNTVGNNMVRLSVLPVLFRHRAYDLSALDSLLTLGGRFPRECYLAAFTALLLLNLWLQYPRKEQPSREKGLSQGVITRDMLCWRSLTLMIYVVPVIALYVATIVL